jgi:hypothetical protein
MENEQKFQDTVNYYNTKLAEVNKKLQDLMSSDYQKSDILDLQIQYELLAQEIDILTEGLEKVIKEAN